MATWDFRILGSLEVSVDGTPVPIQGRRQQIVLVMLLLDANRTVPMESLIDAIWGQRAPATARGQVQMAVSTLRQIFTQHNGSGLISSRPDGYTINVSGQRIDLVQFDSLVTEARDAADRGDTATAVAAFRRGLILWRGPIGVGLSSSALEVAAVRLDERRVAVLEECLKLELQLGRHRELVSELRGLVATYPLREELHACLMLALYRSDRQAEALEASRHARGVLADGHGLDPSKQVKVLERAILTRDPSMNLPDAASEHWFGVGPAPEPDPASAAPASGNSPVPHQLPPPVHGFVGHTDIAAELCDRATRGAAVDAQSVEVIVISGAGGLGKTTLATHIGHQTRDAFPDGQLFARLRSVDAVLVPPMSVLEEFLRVLGMRKAAMPEGVERLAAELRSRLANKRMLIILDDAESVDQVRPLLPGLPGCVVVVTSRRPFATIPASRRVDLPALDEAEGLAMLASTIGQAAVGAEPEAALGLVKVCGGLPLALRITASKVLQYKRCSLGRMLTRLRDEQRVLDELDLDGASVRASIAVSYETLSDRAQRLLLLLGTLGETNFAEWVAAPLLNMDVDTATATLDELVDNSLLIVEGGGAAPTRFRLHDLVRIFTQETIARQIPVDQTERARIRHLQCLLHLVRQAHIKAHGGDFLTIHPEVAVWPLPHDTVTNLINDTPIDWLDLEHKSLVAGSKLAAQLGRTDLCWDLALTSVTLFEARAYTDSWLHTATTAWEACRAIEDELGQAAARYSLASLAMFEDRISSAVEHNQAAMAYFDRVNNVHGRGLVERNLALLDRLQNRPAEAASRCNAALDDLRAVGDVAAEAHVLGNLAEIHLDHGQADEAEQCLHDALRKLGRSDAGGAYRPVAQTRHRLGHVYLTQHRFAEADAEYRLVLDLVTAHGDPVGTAYAHLGLGRAHLARRDFAGANAALARAQQAAEDTGDLLSLGRVLLAQAEAALATGDQAGADSALENARRALVAAQAWYWVEQADNLGLREGNDVHIAEPSPPIAAQEGQ